MDVLFLHGPAAAGKHTIGSLLSPMVDMPLFHNHLVVDAVGTLFEFGTEPFIQLREAFWLSAFQVAADAGRSFIFTFNPEVTVEPALLPRLQTLVEERGGRVLYVELLCSPAGVVNRLESASRAEFGKLRDIRLYEQIRAQGGFEFPPLPTAFVTVDTESLVPIESAHMIAQAYASLKEQ